MCSVIGYSSCTDDGCCYSLTIYSVPHVGVTCYHHKCSHTSQKYTKAFLKFNQKTTYYCTAVPQVSMTYVMVVLHKVTSLCHEWLLDCVYKFICTFCCYNNKQNLINESIPFVNLLVKWPSVALTAIRPLRWHFSLPALWTCTVFATFLSTHLPWVLLMPIIHLSSYTIAALVFNWHCLRRLSCLNCIDTCCTNWHELSW